MLSDQLDRQEPGLFVLYGRRRVGKSALLQRVCRDRRHVFFVADYGSLQQQLDSFSATVTGKYGGVELASWEQALRYCCQQAASQPLILVLDELQHLVAADKTLLPVLRRLWESEICRSRLSIVLCSSSIGFVEGKVLGFLDGCLTGSLLLQPLGFRNAARFLPAWSPEERMSMVGVVGGIPGYLRLVDPELDMATNIKRMVLGEGAPLRDEPRLLLLEELREPQAYCAICRAIVQGSGRQNEIAEAAGFAPGVNISAYLATLREMGLVERRVPVTTRNPGRSRRGVYRLADPFLRFWFRYVLPSSTILETGDAHTVWRRTIEPILPLHVAACFQDACCEYLWRQNREGRLPDVYDRIGGWWRGDHEVDLVGVADGGPLLLAACIWSPRPVGMAALRILEARADAVSTDLPAPPTRIDYALLSRSGFTPALHEEAASRGIHLATVADMI